MSDQLWPTSTSEVRANRVEVPLPGGRTGFLEDLIDSKAQSENFTDILYNVQKYLKEPLADATYAWRDCRHKGALAKLNMEVRSGKARLVRIEELLDDNAAPVTVGRTGEGDFVQIYDLALVEIPKDKAAQMYGKRDAESIRRVVGNEAFNVFRNSMGEHGGLVKASMSVEKH